MKINLYRSLPVLAALCLTMLFTLSPMSYAQSTGDCRDAAGAPIPCTPTPRPRATDVPVQQAQPTALPTNTPEPTAIPLIPLAITGPCVVSPIGTTRVNVRDIPSTEGNILESLLVNSTVPVVAVVELDEEWVLTPLGFISGSALRFGGENCAQLAKIVPPSSTGPFILRQDTDGDGVDDTQYMSIELEDLIISSATDTQSDDSIGFWPNASSPIARLIAGVIEDENGDPTLACTNVKLHNPYNPGNPTDACLDIGDIRGTFVVCFKVNGSGEHCMVGETTNQEVIESWELMTSLADAPDTASGPRVRVFDGLTNPPINTTAHVRVFSGSDGAMALSPFLPLVFVPQPPSGGDTSGDTSVCIDPTDAIYGEPSGGCVLLGSTVIAWCVGDWCLYHEW